MKLKNKYQIILLAATLMFCSFSFANIQLAKTIVAQNPSITNDQLRAMGLPEILDKQPPLNQAHNQNKIDNSLHQLSQQIVKENPNITNDQLREMGLPAIAHRQNDHRSHVPVQAANDTATVDSIYNKILNSTDRFNLLHDAKKYKLNLVAYKSLLIGLTYSDLNRFILENSEYMVKQYIHKPKSYSACFATSGMLFHELSSKNSPVLYASDTVLKYKGNHVNRQMHVAYHYPENRVRLNRLIYQIQAASDRAKRENRNIIFQIFTNQHGYALIIDTQGNAYALQAYANGFSLYEDIKNGAPLLPVKLMTDNIKIQYEVDANKVGEQATRIAWRAAYLASKKDIANRIQTQVSQNRQIIVNFLDHRV